ncbi:Stk1 family PASTA domain-containing Ser/Thr kinase [Alkaliphilus hydrothermalis]|uniref:non-specific serine/threonine protein kinase n=1 Tax=Alkaliphilus hydrothermalis TaxID=1482730 RepID=A0ABS2NSA2_9FIRM|nr:Stk1 family PASTA domain-containing Ser/Thr kinase [Alkaliphilus hydrothermalis]MBM7615845.1 serine/threonine-protein kinase [Alkaliphilus hydrothermalis]
MIGKILGNRYEIVEKIGGGGMAVVYKAKCNLLNRFVAVKILRGEFTNDKDLIDKFKRESQAAASLSHPNVVNIYDVGESEEIYYIVMEYVAGKTLKELIKEKGKLANEEIVDVSRQIAFALRHAHHNHIIHRDIKPHNILVTADHRAKVTDFGIALAATSSTITNAGSVIGSVHYFSPEQARGGYTDEKSDLYSLGITMYEMATGRVPFEGDSPISVALKHIQEKPTKPSQLNPEISKTLEDIILKLMTKEQSARYQNTEELLEDLSRLKNNPNANVVYHGKISEEDSPTQIIPAISDEDLKKNKKEEAPEVSEKKKKKKVKKSVVFSAVFAALILALAFTFGFYYFGGFLGTPEVEVPAFVGLSREEAVALADELKLGLNIKEKYSSEVELDHVISQNPDEGMKVKEGFNIQLLISQGVKQVEVPDLVFKDELDVPYILRNANLVEGEKELEFSDLPAGQVIRQNPRAGAEVPQDSSVDVVISKGPEKVIFLMPNLVGRDLDAVRRTLDQLKLIEGPIKEEYSDEYDVNEVISQSIPAATEVEENTVINLVVSKGPKIEEQPQQPVAPPTTETPAQGDNGNGEGDGDSGEEDEENTVTKTSKSVTIKLDSYSGVIKLDIYLITSTGKKLVHSKLHDIEKDGKRAIFNMTGSGKQTLEIYVNGHLHGEPVVINF